MFHLCFLKRASVALKVQSSWLGLLSERGFANKVSFALAWSSEPVLLHFFTCGGAKEPGTSREDRDRLFKVSDKCSLSLHPSSALPVSSSFGSTESCPPLLWLRWCPLLACRAVRLWSRDWASCCSLCLSLSGRMWGSCGRGMVMSGEWCGGGVEQCGRFETGLRSRGGDALKLSASSTVFCRLPSELPESTDEALWEGCCALRDRPLAPGDRREAQDAGEFGPQTVPGLREEPGLGTEAGWKNSAGRWKTPLELQPTSTSLNFTGLC